MELLRKNFLDTTTMVSVDSNSGDVANLFNRDVTFQYITDGYNGATKTTLRINFASTVTVSRLALMEHNLKVFRAYYNGATANTLALLEGDTASCNYDSNSETSQYFKFAPIACTSLSLDLGEAMAAGAEKAIGFLVVSSVLHEFDRAAPAKGYKPILNPIDVLHKLSDGGTRSQKVSEKWQAQLSYKHIQETEKRALRAVWKQSTEMIFAPFGTTTSWDEVLFPCVWEGAFGFEEFSDDAMSGGHAGKINLMETPK